MIFLKNTLQFHIEILAMHNALYQIGIISSVQSTCQIWIAVIILQIQSSVHEYG